MLIDLVKQTRILMGMPITVEVVDAAASDADLDDVFDYFQYVDDKFSTYKDSSEISRLNRGDLKFDEASDEMKLIFELAEQTRREVEWLFRYLSQRHHRSVWHCQRLGDLQCRRNFS